jgi:hypothetical protein
MSLPVDMKGFATFRSSIPASLPHEECPGCNRLAWAVGGPEGARDWVVPPEVTAMINILQVPIQFVCCVPACPVNCSRCTSFTGLGNTAGREP